MERQTPCRGPGDHNLSDRGHLDEGRDGDHRSSAPTATSPREVVCRYCRSSVGISGYVIIFESLRLSRGKVISKKDIERSPGAHPIYSSSVTGNGVFGYYGDFMFDEELITWSVDGGGHFFYRPKHRFSVTNDCGF